MSLIPERPLLFYPQLAVALGLEGAVMVQTLKELIDQGNHEEHNGFLWVDIPGATLSRLLSFWTDEDIQRITQQLHEQGILLIGSAGFRSDTSFRVAINERMETAPRSPISPRAVMSTPPNRPVDRHAPQVDNQYPAQQPVQQTSQQTSQQTVASPIPARWQPDKDLLAQLGQYGIPQVFSLEQVGEFVTYWSERNEPKHSWAARYLKHVLRLWRQQQTNDFRQSQDIAMAANWRPSPEAMEILTIQADINGNFVEDAIAEFILYWQERGITSNTWNSRFIQHVKRQWARFTNTLKTDLEPRPINPDWRPDEAVFDILHMANIDRPFAEALVAEFILYWQDNGQALSSWNTKFLQYAKRQWAYLGNNASGQLAVTPNDKTNNHHETEQRSRRQGSTKNRDIAAELSDRSWAN